MNPFLPGRKLVLLCAALAIGAGALWGALRLLVSDRASEPARLVHVAVYFSWPEFHGRLEVASEAELGEVQAHLEGATAQPGDVDPRDVLWKLDLSFRDGSGASLAVSAGHRLFLGPGESDGLPPSLRTLLPGGPPGAPVELVSPQLTDWARARIDELESRFYGELLTWPQVSPHFPVGGTAEVRDLETGRSFRVRRHRGDSHADVEPLTAADSRTLKEIYGGEWSWKRRAVVVTVGELAVAGSMNGMPHGWGDLFENEFVGHSCIHFWQSRVHGTWREDPGHQLQVLKAAGLLVEALDSATSEELVTWAVAALNHYDVVSLRHMSGHERAFGADDTPATGEDAEFSILLNQLILPIRHISYHGARLKDEGERSAAVEVSATVYYHRPDPDRGYLRTTTAKLRRANPDQPWRIDLSSLIPLARPGATGAVSALSDARYDAIVQDELAMGCKGREGV